MHVRSAPSLVALSLLALAAWPSVGAAQIHRCVTPTGDEVFTDRACDAVGAVEQRPQAPADAGNRALARALSLLLQAVPQVRPAWQPPP